MKTIIHLIEQFTTVPVSTACGQYGLLVSSDKTRVTCKACLKPRQKRGGRYVEGDTYTRKP